jgi:hypothetical protein
MFYFPPRDINLKDRNFGRLPQVHGALSNHANPSLRFVIGFEEQGWPGKEPGFRLRMKQLALGAKIRAAMASPGIWAAACVMLFCSFQ